MRLGGRQRTEYLQGQRGSALPDLMSRCQGESQKFLEAYVLPFCEWNSIGLMYVKLCRDNSLPRQSTNPLDYAFGVSPKQPPPYHLGIVICSYSNQGQDS